MRACVDTSVRGEEGCQMSVKMSFQNVTDHCCTAVLSIITLVTHHPRYVNGLRCLPVESSTNSVEHPVDLQLIQGG